jgi:hypothetical protein
MRKTVLLRQLHREARRAGVSDEQCFPCHLFNFRVCGFLIRSFFPLGSMTQAYRDTHSF